MDHTGKIGEKPQTTDDVSAPANHDLLAPYTGRYRFGVDRSHRLSLPARWRQDGMPDEFVVMLWPVGVDRHLLALPIQRWEEVLRTVLDQRSLFDEKVNAGVRALGSNVGYVSVDKVGRMALPEQLVRSAGIKDEVEIFGLIDRFEIWNPDRYAGMELEYKPLASAFFKELAHETGNSRYAEPPAVPATPA